MRVGEDGLHPVRRRLQDIEDGAEQQEEEEDEALPLALVRVRRLS